MSLNEIFLMPRPQPARAVQFDGTNIVEVADALGLVFESEVWAPDLVQIDGVWHWNREVNGGALSSGDWLSREYGILQANSPLQVVPSANVAYDVVNLDTE